MVLEPLDPAMPTTALPEMSIALTSCLISSATEAGGGIEPPGRAVGRFAQSSTSFSDLSKTRSTRARSWPRFITRPPAATTL